MGDLQVSLTYWGSVDRSLLATPSQLLVCAATGAVVVVDGCGSISYWDCQGRPVSVVRPRKRISAVCTCVHFGRPATACFLDDGEVVVADVRDGSVFAESTNLYANRTAQYAAEVCEGISGYCAPYVLVVDTHCAAALIDSNTLTMTTRFDLPPPGFVIASCWYRSTLAIVMPDKTLRFWRVDEPHREDGAAGAAAVVPQRAAAAALIASQPTLVALPLRGIPAHISHHPFLPLTLVVTVNAWLLYYDLAPTDPVCRGHVDDVVAAAPDHHTVFQAGAFAIDPDAQLFLGEKYPAPANPSFHGGVRRDASFISQPVHPSTQSRGVSRSHIDVPGDVIQFTKVEDVSGDEDPPLCVLIVSSRGIGHGYRVDSAVTRLAVSKRRHSQLEGVGSTAKAKETFTADLFPTLQRDPDAATSGDDESVLFHLTTLPATKAPLKVASRAPMAPATPASPVSPQRARASGNDGTGSANNGGGADWDAPEYDTGVMVTAITNGQLLSTTVPLSALVGDPDDDDDDDDDAGITNNEDSGEHPNDQPLSKCVDGEELESDHAHAPPMGPLGDGGGGAGGGFSLLDVLEGRAEVPPPPPAATGPSLLSILEGAATIDAPPPAPSGGGFLAGVLDGTLEIPPPSGDDGDAPAEATPPKPRLPPEHALKLQVGLVVDMYACVTARCLGNTAGCDGAAAAAAGARSVTASYLHCGDDEVSRVERALAAPLASAGSQGGGQPPKFGAGGDSTGGTAGAAPTVISLPLSPSPGAGGAGAVRDKEKSSGHHALSSVSSTLQGVGHAVWGGVKHVGGRSPRKGAQQQPGAPAAPPVTPAVAVPSPDRVEAAAARGSDKPYLFYGYSDGGIEVLAIGSDGSRRHGWSAFDGSAVQHIATAGQRLYTADDWGSVRSWAWGTWAPLHAYTLHEGPILRPIRPPAELRMRHDVEVVCVGHEGNVSMYTAAGEGYVFAGNLAYGGGNTTSPRAGVGGGGSSSPTGVHYLPDVECLAVCDGLKQTIHIWHVVSRALVRVVEGDGFTMIMASLYDSPNLATLPFGPPMPGVASLTFDLSPVLRWVKQNPDVFTGVGAADGASEEGRGGLLRCILSHLLEADSDAIVKVREALKLDRLVADGGCRLPVGGVGFSQLQGLVSMHAVTPGAPAGSASPSYHRHRDASAVSSWEVFHLPCATPYEVSPLGTARRVVAVLALLHSLSQLGGRLQPLFKDAVHYYASALPPILRSAPHAYEADFFWCLDSIKDPLRDIQFAARCGLNGVLRLRNATELRELTSAMMRVKTRGGTAEQVQVSYLGISVMVAQCPELMRQDEEVARYALNGLSQLCLSPPDTANPTLQGVALSHLADSYGLWAPLVKDSTTLMRTLLAMSTTQDGYERLSQPVSKAAFRAFKACALHHLSAFFTFADQVLGEVQAPRDEDTLPSQNCVLYSIAQMIKSNAVLFIPYLLRVALVFLKALDPHFPRVRDKCVVTSAQALKTAVSTFPMMSFHQSKQSLVVGDTNGQCVVWDTTTGAKCFVWHAHEHQPVTCVAFSALGDQMATFSLREGKVKIWSSDMSLFALLSPSHRPTLKTTLSIPTDRLVMSSAEVLQHVKISWTSPRTIELAYAEGQARMFEI